MSASGYKRTLWDRVSNVRFTPKSGPNWVTEFMSAYDPKRTVPTGHKRPSSSGLGETLWSGSLGLNLTQITINNIEHEHIAGIERNDVRSS